MISYKHQEALIRISAIAGSLLKRPFGPPLGTDLKTAVVGLQEIRLEANNALNAKDTKTPMKPITLYYSQPKGMFPHVPPGDLDKTRIYMKIQGDDIPKEGLRVDKEVPEDLYEIATLVSEVINSSELSESSYVKKHARFMEWDIHRKLHQW